MPSKEYSHQYYLNNKDRIKPIHKKWLQKNIGQLVLKRREARLRTRIEILKLLGNKCVYCGYSKNWKALEIDHICSNGAEHRQRIKDVWTMYRQILKEIKSGSKDYQLLCSNCNRIKAYDEAENRRKYRGD